MTPIPVFYACVHLETPSRQCYWLVNLGKGGKTKKSRMWTRYHVCTWTQVLSIKSTIYAQLTILATHASGAEVKKLIISQVVVVYTFNLRCLESQGPMEKFLRIPGRPKNKQKKPPDLSLKKQ